MRPMSIRMVSVPNCWAPIACRPPAMLIARPSALAWRTTAWMAPTESGLTTRLTRVSLSWEWTSLTTTPAGGFSVGAAPAFSVEAAPALSIEAAKSERPAHATTDATILADCFHIGVFTSRPPRPA